MNLSFVQKLVTTSDRTRSPSIGAAKSEITMVARIRLHQDFKILAMCS